MVKCVLHNVQKSTLIKFVSAFSEDCGKSSGVPINFSNLKFLLVLPDFFSRTQLTLEKRKIKIPAHQCSFFSFTHSATCMHSCSLCSFCSSQLSIAHKSQMTWNERGACSVRAEHWVKATSKQGLFNDMSCQFPSLYNKLRRVSLPKEVLFAWI